MTRMQDQEEACGPDSDDGGGGGDPAAHDASVQSIFEVASSASPLSHPHVPRLRVQGRYD